MSFLCMLALLQAPASLPAEFPSLEELMADPAWIGSPPLNPYWSDDSESIYFEREVEPKRPGSLRDLYRIQASGEIGSEERIAAAQWNEQDFPGTWNVYRTRKAWERGGDIWWKKGIAGENRRLTLTAEREDSPQWLLDGRLVYRRGSKLLARTLETGMDEELFRLRFEDDPAVEEDLPKDADERFRKERQYELIETLEEAKERRRVRRAERRWRLEARDGGTAMPWYLGEDLEARGSHLSPRGDELILVTAPENSGHPKRDVMPEYVTESTYVETDNVRPHVGEGRRTPQTARLMRNATHETIEFDWETLPGFGSSNSPDQDDGEEEDPDERKGLSIWRVLWSPRGERAAMLLRSNDNHQRWIVTVERESGKMTCVHHLVDDAWIGRFNELGWTKNGETLWFLSEESGWSHLYSADLQDGEFRTRALTQGEFEVSGVRLISDESTFLVNANIEQPGRYQPYWISRSGGELRPAVSGAPARSRAMQSPDGEKFWILGSSWNLPDELYVSYETKSARALTRSSSEAFESISWTQPLITPVMASRGDRQIWVRHYPPQNNSDFNGILAPCVVFIHGAGYLQNVHHGWSSYFREFMFHSLLTREGFAVIDIDYRASAGYGRDWRTAVAGNMGEPELEDIAEVLAWYSQKRGDNLTPIDPERVGIYGGSYGGFVTLMGLFKRPDLFACGAALRPVTDWSHYNDGYTANILGTPEENPDAFLRSSPIEFAEGLEDPLLICHGLVDDNVLAKDSIRLAQRLIELGKEDFELALYPMEAHGFVEADAWIDEYRRIHRLFREHLLEKP